MPACKQIIRKIQKRVLCFFGAECGQSAVTVALAFVVLLGGAAFAIDLGASYAAQQKLQNAADEAALAAARTLANPASSAGEAREIALDFAELNGAEREKTTVTVPYQGDPYKVEVICTRDMTYSFAKVLGKDKGRVSARAVAEALPMRGPFDYSIFSGDENYELPMNVGKMRINGSVHSNDDMALRSGDIVINGTVETVNELQINNGVEINGEIIAGKTYKNGRVISTGPKGPVVEMPDFTEEIKAAAKQAGQYYTSSKTFNADEVSVDQPIYVEGDVTFNTPTVICGNGVIIATGNITFNAASVLAPNSSVCYYSKNKDIMIHVGGISVEGLLYAPNGSIKASFSTLNINGRIVANKVEIYGSEVNISWGEHDRDCLPRHEISLIE